MDEPSLEPQEASQDVESGSAVEWAASEYVAHQKTSGWYLALAIIAIIISVPVYLISKDFVSVFVVFFGATMLAYFGARKPRTIDYKLDPMGITIGTNEHPFETFRSFSVIEEGAFSTIVFMPHKRFALATNIYYPLENEDQIIKIISKHIPIEERSHDPIDRLMRAIRF